MAQGTTKGVPIDIDPLLAADSDLLVPSQKAIKTYTDLGLSNKVNRSGDTMSGYLVLNANPVSPLQAATKDYVDTLINGIDWKQSVNAATVAALPAYNVTGSGQILTGTVNGAIPSATTDGVTLVANQRVLVKNETLTLTPNNGIYTVTQAGSPSLPFILTRSTDANTPTLLAEATVSVSGGSTLANTQWHCNPAAVPVVIGTTYITFAQIGSGTYTFSPPLVNTGNIISIPVATSIANGYLSSADWSNFNTAYTNRITSLTTTGNSGAATLSSNTLNVPNYTLSGLGGVPTIRTLTINGTAQDLSADRTWSVGTVTSVAALTLGTSGTDLSSTVANSTTTPVITLNVPTASATNRGVLTSSDWTNFNNKPFYLIKDASAIFLTTILLQNTFYDIRTFNVNKSDLQTNDLLEIYTNIYRPNAAGGTGNGTMKIQLLNGSAVWTDVAQLTGAMVGKGFLGIRRLLTWDGSNIIVRTPDLSIADDSGNVSSATVGGIPTTITGTSGSVLNFKVVFSRAYTTSNQDQIQTDILLVKRIR